MGRLGVDAVALVSMGGALLLGETTVAVVIAVMYAGGTALGNVSGRPSVRFSRA